MRISIEKYIKYQDIDSKKKQKLTGSLTNRRKKPKKLNNYTSNVIKYKKVNIKDHMPRLKNIKDIIDFKDE
jgi:hypothetical protein